MREGGRGGPAASGVLAIGFFLMAPEVAEDGAMGAEVLKAAFGGYPALVQDIDIIESG